MAYQYFRHPISWLEQSIRKFYCYTMRWLGYPNFVVRAQGVFFLVGLTDMIDRSIAIFGIWESDQVDHLAHVCDSQKADYFFDIGANAGVYSILFTLKGLVPEAVAFEPDPGNYAHLLSNIYINNLTEKIKAFPLAVGDRSGEVDLMQADVFNRGESWIAHPDKPPEEAVGVATHCVKQIRLDDEFSLSNKTLVMPLRLSVGTVLEGFWLVLKIQGVGIGRTALHDSQQDKG